METVWDTAFDADQESQEVVEETEKEEVSIDTFGLMQLGYLTDSLNVFGHKVNIRTLKLGEELEAELLISKYRDTNEANRAYATALVAACIQSIDGKPLIQGFGPSDESLEKRFYFITEHWHWITVQKIFDAYSELVKRATDSMEEIKKD